MGRCPGRDHPPFQKARQRRGAIDGRLPTEKLCKNPRLAGCFAEAGAPGRRCCRRRGNLLVALRSRPHGQCYGDLGAACPGRRRTACTYHGS